LKIPVIHYKPGKQSIEVNANWGEADEFIFGEGVTAGVMWDEDIADKLCPKPGWVIYVQPLGNRRGLRIFQYNEEACEISGLDISKDKR